MRGERGKARRERGERELVWSDLAATVKTIWGAIYSKTGD